MESGIAVVVGEVEAGHDCVGSRYLSTVKPVGQPARTFFRSGSCYPLIINTLFRPSVGDSKY